MLLWDRTVLVNPIRIIIKVTTIANFIFLFSLTFRITRECGAYTKPEI